MKPHILKLITTLIFLQSAMLTHVHAEGTFDGTTGSPELEQWLNDRENLLTDDEKTSLVNNLKEKYHGSALEEVVERARRCSLYKVPQDAWEAIELRLKLLVNIKPEYEDNSAECVEVRLNALRFPEQLRRSGEYARERVKCMEHQSPDECYKLYPFKNMSDF